MYFTLCNGLMATEHQKDCTNECWVVRNWYKKHFNGLMATEQLNGFTNEHSVIRH